MVKIHTTGCHLYIQDSFSDMQAQNQPTIQNLMRLKRAPDQAVELQHSDCHILNCERSLTKFIGPNVTSKRTRY